MSVSEIERFFRDAKAKPSLLAEAAKGNRLDAFVSVAARHGYSFSLEEAKTFVKAKAKAAGRELSDAELEQASGGNALGDLIRGMFPPGETPPYMLIGTQSR